MTDVTDVVVQYGFETLFRVFNNTGVTIPNGSPIVATGVVSVDHYPHVELAQADTYVNSKVRGVATNDIGPGEVGYATTHGLVNGVDMSAFAEGDTLYLDDNTPGTYTTTPPDIVTQVGEVRHNGVTDGILYVDIESNTELPTVFGHMYQTGEVYAVTTSHADLDTYSVSNTIVCPVVLATGVIQPGYSGLYRTSFTINMSFASSVASRTVFVRLYDKTAGAAVASIDTSIPIARDITAASRSMQLPHTVIADHEYVLQISASTAMSITVDDLSFDMQSIQIS